MSLPPFVIQTPSLQKESLINDKDEDQSRLTDELKERIKTLKNDLLPKPSPSKRPTRSVLSRRKSPAKTDPTPPPSLLATIQAAAPTDLKFESLYQLLQYVKGSIAAVLGGKRKKEQAQFQLVQTDGADEHIITLRHAGALVEIVFEVIVDKSKDKDDTDDAPLDTAERPIAIVQVKGEEGDSSKNSPKRSSRNKEKEEEDAEKEDSDKSPKRKTKEELQEEWDKKWFAMLDKVKAFQEKTGHANVPKDYIPDRSLGSWVASQRTAYKEGKLKQHRIDALEALDFVWSFRTIGKAGDMNLKKQNTDEVDWDEPAVQRKWKAMLERLKEYKEKTGDVRVPSGWKEDPPLAYWVQNQRVLYKKEKLPQDRIDALEEIGFLWKVGNKGPRPSSVAKGNNKVEQDAKWYDLLERLKAFKEEFGHTVVQQRYERDLELGKWVQNQRRVEKDGKIKPERKAELDALGFVWKVGTMGERTWEENFQRLLEFKEKWGDTLVPTKYEPDQRLASWVMWQRGKYHQNKLPDEYIAKLDSVGFVWKVQRKGRRINHMSDVRGGYKNTAGFVIWSPSTSNEFWEAQLEKLKAFKAKFGHTNVPVVYFEDLQLAKWVTAQRMMHTKGQLQQDRIDKLEEVGFNWRLVRTWEDNFARLKEYHEKTGNCDVPVDYPEDPKLGRWVKTQKAFSKRKELSVERLEKLQSLGFVWNQPKGAPKTPPNSSANKPTTTPASGVEMPAEKAARLKATNARLSEDRRNLEAENKELRRKLKEAEEVNNWEERFEQLLEYVAENGDPHVPTGASKLGGWVALQRDQYKRKVLSQERIDKLEGVGFEWVRKRGKRPASSSPEKEPLAAPAKKQCTTTNNAEILAEEEKLQREKDKLAEAKKKLEEEKQKLLRRRESLEAAKKRRKV